MTTFTRSLEGRDAATQAAATRWRPSANAVALTVFLVMCGAAALAGALFAETGTDSWYADLDKPSFTPPASFLTPVWAAMYAVMALAAWRVWRRLGPEPDRSRALVVWGVELLLSALWMPIFFGAQAPYLSMLVVSALWLAALAVVLTFASVDPWSAVMNLPYLAVVTYASVWNAAIILMQ
jgi:benzodiazapine receptor